MCHKLYPNVLLAFMAFSINFYYCSTVEQQQEQYYSRNLNINTLSHGNSTFSPSTQQLAFATSNTLSPPPATSPSSLSSSDQHHYRQRQQLPPRDTVELQFMRDKYKLLDHLSANKTALFKSIIKKRDIIAIAEASLSDDVDGELPINFASRRLLMENVVAASAASKFSITQNASEIYPSSVINDTTQQHPTSLSNIINNNSNDSSMFDQTQLCDEFEDENCIIDHDVVCVGDPQYCNLTYEQYTGLLLEYITPTTSEWILIVSHSIVFIMGLVGNALVCIAVYTNHSMRTVTNIFIVNLAVADFFVILFCLPPTVLWDVTETWFFGEAMCKVVIYFQTVSVTVSVLTLTFISMDRWYAICFPLRYKPKPERAWRTLGVIWIIAFLSDIPEFLVLRTKQRVKLRFGSKLFTQCAAEWEIEDERRYNIIKLVLLYAVPLIIMAIAYFQIVRVLWRSDTIPGHRESRNHQSCSLHGTGRTGLNYHSNPTTMGQLRARRKAAKMLVAVVLLFASCYFPVHALNVARYATNMEQNEVISVLSLLSHWLCYANSACNPVIYNFMSGKFRREFKNALEKCRCLKSNRGIGGRVGGYEERSMYHTATRMNISPSTRSNYQLTSVRDFTGHTAQTLQTSFNGNNLNNHQISPVSVEERIGLTTTAQATTTVNGT
ncbi:orexin receptor type 2-like isoform X2 [Culicoides brevitarsis]|uniref:orexin receptor type 2-like isoform X2 n=1 Tax=Culicoides brevitarsis TaxID=469753 RepID=UPI00307C5335